MTDKLTFVQRILCLPGKLVSWLILPLVISIIVSVVSARQGWSTLLDWEGSVPVFGDALTVNSLVDIQWYIFSLIVLFGGIWAYVEDRHVTVDFIAIKLSDRTRAYISLFGNILLLLPLCIMVIWFGSKFAAVSFRTHEGSIQGGLTAHWLIKGALPVSFALLGMAALAQSFKTLRAILRNQFPTTDIHHDS